MKPANSRMIEVGDIVLLNKKLAESGRHDDLTSFPGKWVIVGVGTSCKRKDCAEDYGCSGYLSVKNLKNGHTLNRACWGWGRGNFMWILEEQVPELEKLQFHITEVIENDFE